jgi:hypothetical protein
MNSLFITTRMAKIYTRIRWSCDVFFFGRIWTTARVKILHINLGEVGVFGRIWTTAGWRLFGDGVFRVRTASARVRRARQARLQQHLLSEQFDLQVDKLVILQGIELLGGFLFSRHFPTNADAFIDQEEDEPDETRQDRVKNNHVVIRAAIHIIFHAINHTPEIKSCEQVSEFFEDGDSSGWTERATQEYHE